MKLTAAESLKRALKLIQKGWTQGTLARDQKGAEVSSSSRSAVQWCALGALTAYKAADDIEAAQFIRRCIPARYDNCVSDWNDSPRRTKQEVISVFKKAIKLAEAQTA